MTAVATSATVPGLPQTMPPSVQAIVKSVLATTRCLVPVFSTIDRNSLIAHDVSVSYVLKHEDATLECDVAVIRLMDGYAEVVFQVMSGDFDVAREDRILIHSEMESQLGDVDVDDLSGDMIPGDDEPYELRFQIPVAKLY